MVRAEWLAQKSLLKLCFLSMQVRPWKNIHVWRTIYSYRAFLNCPDLRGSFIASEVCNQPAIWSVMFNDSSKHRLVVSGPCVHLLKLLEATLCGDKKKKGSNKAFSPAADPPSAAVLVNHSKQLEILSKGIISGSGAFGP